MNFENGFAIVTKFLTNAIVTKFLTNKWFVFFDTLFSDWEVGGMCIEKSMLLLFYLNGNFYISLNSVHSSSTRPVRRCPLAQWKMNASILANGQRTNNVNQSVFY